MSGLVLAATTNPGKLREIDRLLRGSGHAVVSLADRGITEPYEEIGASYEENARGKALHYAALSGLPTVADDSGLEVEALGGMPGIGSARFGGPGLDDVGRNRLLIQVLGGVASGRRQARYVAVVALAVPAPDLKGGGAAVEPARVLLFRGTCEGMILNAPRGEGGFGYDPLFFYPPLDATFAELPAARKDEISHRGRAFAALAAHLESAGRVMPRA